jgi:hypothetical protein
MPTHCARYQLASRYFEYRAGIITRSQPDARPANAGKMQVRLLNAQVQMRDISVG